MTEMMLALIEEHLTDIANLCRKHRVRRLELFGSAVRGGFDPRKSDLDFFVEFTDYTAPTIADQWFGLQEDLQAVFSLPVELVSLRTVSNPYFLEVANREKVVLFAA
jgi:predicted nucleotidyltransferase